MVADMVLIAHNRPGKVDSPRSAERRRHLDMVPEAGTVVGIVVEVDIVVVPEARTSEAGWLPLAAKL
jgi:hypothetical protein